MKKISYGIGQDGRLMAVLISDGNRVAVVSEDTRVEALNGRTLALRVAKEVGNVIADGFVSVVPGESGYPDAVIDTLEGMGIDVVG